MPHPTDDELIEHFCGDAAPSERERIETHMRECARCQQAWDDMAAALTMVNDAVPEPPDGFERVVWARVRQAIEIESATPPRRSIWTWRTIVPAGALAAAVIALVLTSRSSGALAPVVDTAVGDAARANLRQNERVLFTALDEHFQQTEALLVELRNAPDKDGLELERVTADDLVASGRLYRQTAEYTGHEGLVRMLDDLEPVLVEVARGSNQMGDRDRQWLRTRIEDDNLLFKVRAANFDVRERAGHNDH